jgi:hypothetical protein
VQTWFVCISDNSLALQRDPLIKPWVGVYLSERVAARLAEAAKNPRATKSALVEAALDRFLGSDDDISDTAAVARHLAGLSRQLVELDRNLRIANETAAPVGADFELSRKRAFDDLAVDGGPRQPGSGKHGFQSDDTLWFAHGRAAPC